MARDFSESRIFKTGELIGAQFHLATFQSADIPKYRLSSGDLVFARTGATTGKSFLIGECPEAVFASYLIRVRVSADVDSRYLSAFFQSPDYWRQIEGGKRGIGQPNVNGTVLGEVQFPVAPLPEQRRIVAEIEKQFTRLEAGVAALRRVQANLKRYRAAVLKAACEGKLVPTEAELAKKGNRKSKFETGEALLARILIERRKNWQGRGQYTEPSAPVTAKLAGFARQAGQWPTLGATCGNQPGPANMLWHPDAQRECRDWRALREGQRHEGRHYRLGTDFIGRRPRTRQSMRGLRLELEICCFRYAARMAGSQTFLKELDGGNITQDTARLDVTGLVNHRYVATCLRNPDCQNHFKRVARGVAVKGVNIGDVRPTPVPLPPADRADADRGGSGATFERGRGVGSGGDRQPPARHPPPPVHFAESIRR